MITQKDNKKTKFKKGIKGSTTAPCKPLPDQYCGSNHLKGTDRLYFHLTFQLKRVTWN